MRKKRLVFTLLWLMALVLAAGPAFATPIVTDPTGLVLSQIIGLSGTGEGNVPQVLNFHNPPPSGSVSGCVGWNGTVSVFSNNTVCPPDAIGDRTYLTFGPDAWPNKSQTQLLSDVGIASPWDLTVILDPSQATPLIVSRMSLTFYLPDGSSFYTALLPSPLEILDPGTGSGGSGFMFSLDWDSALAVQNALGSLPSGVTFADLRIGVGAEINQITGNTYYFVANSPNIAVPEPASFFLIGAGLLGIPLLVRRRRQA